MTAVRVREAVTLAAGRGEAAFSYQARREYEAAASAETLAEAVVRHALLPLPLRVRLAGAPGGPDPAAAGASGTLTGYAPAQRAAQVECDDGRTVDLVVGTDRFVLLEPAEGLSDFDKAVLDFTRLSFRYPGSRIQAMRDRFRFWPEQYYQRLNRLIDTPEAYRYDPAVVKGLLARRDTMREARAGRRRPVRAGR